MSYSNLYINGHSFKVNSSNENIAVLYEGPSMSEARKLFERLHLPSSYSTELPLVQRVLYLVEKELIGTDQISDPVTAKVCLNLDSSKKKSLTRLLELEITNRLRG